MAVNEPIRVAGPFVGDGSLVELDFDFETFAVSDVSVAVVNADDVEDVLTLNTDYTVTLNSGSAGGSVTLLSPLATGTTAHVYGDAMAYTRTGNITANPGGFFPSIVNAALDRVHIGLLQLADKLGRAIILPHDGETVAGRFPVVLPDGSFGWSTGAGADDGLRVDLATRTLGAALLAFWQDSSDAATRTSLAKQREEVSVTDFDGATLQDQIDNALDHLATFGGGDLIFPRGTYTLGAEYDMTARSNIRFIGKGAVITGSGAAMRSYFNMDGCAGVAFTGFHFKTRFGLVPTYTDFDDGVMETPIRFRNGSKLLVRDCVFEQLYTCYIDLYASSDIEVSSNHFSSPLQDQDQRLSFVEALSCGGAISIVHNVFIGATTTVNDKSPCAVSVSGISGSLSITGNYATHCGRNNAGAHRLGVFDIYADAANVKVLHNFALNCREQFMRASTCVDVTVEGNVVTMAAQVDTTYSTLSIESGSFPGVTNAICRRIRVQNNNFRCLGNVQAFCVGIASYDWGSVSEEIFFEGNVVHGYEQAFRASGPVKSLSVSRNKARNVKALFDLLLTGGVTLTTTLGAEAASVFDNIRVEDNDVELTAGSALIPVSFSTNRGSPYTGSVGDVSCKRNRISGAPSGTTVAINAVFNASVEQGTIVISDNDIHGFSTPFYLRSLRRATVRNNFCSSVTADFILTDGSAGLIEQSGNRRSGKGALKGSVTLVAGTATVATTEIMSGDRVRVWREVRGGTTGADLICDAANIVAGTSLRIDAIDTAGATVATDTSTVGWEIVGR